MCTKAKTTERRIEPWRTDETNSHVNGFGHNKDVHNDENRCKSHCRTALMQQMCSMLRGPRHHCCAQYPRPLQVSPPTLPFTMPVLILLTAGNQHTSAANKKNSCSWYRKQQYALNILAHKGSVMCTADCYALQGAQCIWSTACCRSCCTGSSKLLCQVQAETSYLSPHQRRTRTLRRSTQQYHHQ